MRRLVEVILSIGAIYGGIEIMFAVIRFSGEVYALAAAGSAAGVFVGLGAAISMCIGGIVFGLGSAGFVRSVQALIRPAGTREGVRGE